MALRRSVISARPPANHDDAPRVMRFAALRWFPAALALLLPACFSDGGFQGPETGATGTSHSTGSTGSTGSTATTTTGDDTTTTTTSTGATSTGTTATDPTGTTTDPGTGTAPASTSTGPAPCLDPGPEPNEDEATANDLGIHQCGGTPGIGAGVLDGELDIDWFHFAASHPSPMCNQLLTSQRLAVELGSAGPLRLCLFPACIDPGGELDFECPQDASPTLSPLGVAGCCSDGSMDFEINCAGTPDDDLAVLVRLDQAPADACVEYEFTYIYEQL